MSAVESTAAELRQEIVDGVHRPGERLREVELAERFGISRHTLRAVLRALAAERLVRIEPNRGASVTELSGDELRALFELRAALEVEAARLLESRAGFDPWPDAVAAASRELQDACAAPHPDPAAIDSAHAALHHALVAAAGSARITQAHAALAQESRVVLLQSRAVLTPQRMAELHRELLDDLLRRGPEPVRTHLEGGRAATRGPGSRPGSDDPR